MIGKTEKNISTRKLNWYLPPHGQITSQKHKMLLKDSLPKRPVCHKADGCSTRVAEVKDSLVLPLNGKCAGVPDAFVGLHGTLMEVTAQEDGSFWPLG